MCLTCGKRPRKRGEQYCWEHARQIAADKSAARERCAPVWNRAFKVLHYRGEVVALMPGSSTDSFRPVYVGNNKRVFRADGITPIPALTDKLINLDVYCPGYDRAQIKTFKKIMAQVAEV